MSTEGQSEIVVVESVNELESVVFFNDLIQKQLEARAIVNYYKVHHSFAKEKDLNTIAWYVVETQLNNDPTFV